MRYATRHTCTCCCMCHGCMGVCFFLLCPIHLLESARGPGECECLKLQCARMTPGLHILAHIQWHGWMRLSADCALPLRGVCGGHVLPAWPCVLDVECCELLGGRKRRSVRCVTAFSSCFQAIVPWRCPAPFWNLLHFGTWGLPTCMPTLWVAG